MSNTCCGETARRKRGKWGDSSRRVALRCSLRTCHWITTAVGQPAAPHTSLFAPLLVLCGQHTSKIASDGGQCSPAARRCLAEQTCCAAWPTPRSQRFSRSTLLPSSRYRVRRVECRCALPLRCCRARCGRAEQGEWRGDRVTRERSSMHSSRSSTLLTRLSGWGRLARRGW